MAELLKGKPVADALTEEVAARVERLREHGVQPTLAIVRVGERPDDVSYERGASKRCQAAGIKLEVFALPADCSQALLMEAIDQVNADASIHGCLPMRPLPAHLDEAAACAALDPAKDMDGITDGSLLGVFADRPLGFPPCTAEACVRILDYYGCNLEGADVTVVGRSLVIGKPVSLLLQAKHATVTMCHTRTKNLEEACRKAQVLVVAAGRPKVIGADAVAPGQVVIDVGINWDEAAGKLVGDVDFEAVEPIVGAITPVPGGVGSVTTAVLASHVVEAAERAAQAVENAASRGDGGPEAAIDVEAVTGSFASRSCEEFAARLAGPESVPGGGGAAAMTAALAAALASMVANFTTGKKKYAVFEQDIQRILAEADSARVRLLQLVDEDAAAFQPLSQAYAIPKDDLGRPAVLEAATKAALQPPLQVMGQVAAVIDLLEELNQKGSRMLLSDVGCGAALAAAAMQAAAINVLVNTQALADRDFARAIDEECNRLLAAVPRAQTLAEAVTAQLR